MKRIVFGLLFLTATTFCFAQYEPKGKTTKAEAALTSGKLDIAKAEIDEAFKVDKKGKVTSDGKNWYLRGRVYKAIYLDDSTQFAELDDQALDKAVESFSKVKEMEKETSSYFLFTDQEMSNLYGNIINKGANAYNENDFELAYEEFMDALKVMPGDTTALLYGGTAAQQAGNTDAGIKAYEELIEVGTSNIDVYKTLIYLYRTEQNDLEKVLQTTRAALETFPENKDLKQEEITTLILLERTDEAATQLNKAIEDEPNNPLLYYELGYLYDFQERYDDALAQYQKAIEVDPSHYESNYNAGVVYFNKAAAVLKELNNLSLEDYRKQEKTYYDSAVVHFKNALPYLEKAAEVKPNQDVQLLETLEGVYIRLKMTDKAEALEKRIQALSGAEE
jgi:tetratricopeptide (TPR) repeat protein